jgi:hypothetical protein
MTMIPAAGANTIVATTLVVTLVVAAAVAAAVAVVLVLVLVLAAVVFVAGASGRHRLCGCCYG